MRRQEISGGTVGPTIRDIKRGIHHDRVTLCPATREREAKSNTVELCLLGQRRHPCYDRPANPGVCNKNSFSCLLPGNDLHHRVMTVPDFFFQGCTKWDTTPTTMIIYMLTRDQSRRHVSRLQSSSRTKIHNPPIPPPTPPPSHTHTERVLACQRQISFPFKLSFTAAKSVSPKCVPPYSPLVSPAITTEPS